ncbi:MAG: DUF488 family protein, partial [Desulfovibrionaceae bacterium]
MLSTSFFASKAPKERKVCIAKWNRFWKGPRATLFAPSNPKAEDWAAAFQCDLESRFPTAQSLRRYLAEIEQATPNPILCCFELDEKQCHRRVLAAYIKKMLNID